MQENQVTKIWHDGFTKKVMTSNNRLLFNLYTKDPVIVFRNQIIHTPQDEISINFFESNTYTHQINSEVEVLIYRVVQETKSTLQTPYLPIELAENWDWYEACNSYSLEGPTCELDVLSIAPALKKIPEDKLKSSIL